MFTKYFFLILLSSTLILASPIPEEENGLLGVFGSWLKTADKALTGIVNMIKKPFEDTFKMVTKTGEQATQQGTNVVQQVFQAYENIVDKSEKEVNEAKNRILENIVKELQKVINNKESGKKLQEETKEIVQFNKDTLIKLQQQLQKVIDAENVKFKVKTI